MADGSQKVGVNMAQDIATIDDSHSKLVRREAVEFGVIC